MFGVEKNTRIEYNSTLLFIHEKGFMATLLQIENISKAYGHQVIFNQASLTIQEQKKIGVIGRNGAGKSTLFKMLTGHEEVDTGTVNVYRQARLGYLEQHDPFKPGETVVGFLTRYTGKEEWQCGKVASQFQLNNGILSSRIDSLAGGYQMRVKLTAMLLEEPNLLLLDEPTNYLDLSTQLLFEQFLKSFRGGYMIISHDREFLKNVTDHTLEIDQGSMFLYPRPLEEYFDYKEEQLELKEKTNQNIMRQQKHLQKFVDRFAAKASKASQAKSKLKQIQRLKTIDIGHALSSVRIQIPKIEKKKGIALEIKDLFIGYGESKIVAGGINLSIDRGEHIAIVGDNGQGKTTFLKTLAGELSPLSGSFRWMSDIKIAYYAQHVPGTLNPKDQVFNYLTRCAAPDVSLEEVYKMASNFLFKDSEAKKKIGMLSGGERARLYLAGLLLKKTQVLLLDETSNHLDFETVEALAYALKKCNNTILFISHNRTFVNMLATGIVEINNGSIERYHHNYEEYVNDLEQRATQDGKIIKPLSLPRQEVLPEKTKQSINRKDTQKEIRSQKKIIRDIEKAMEEYENEKQEIFQFFAENPTAYSPEKSKQLVEIKKIIEKQENKWLKAQEKLEELSGVRLENCINK
jgi:ATP-binding cassette subfamily F protein 3